MANSLGALPIPALSGDAGLYLSGEEWIRVRTLGDALGRAFTVSGRYLQVGSGRVNVFASRHLPISAVVPDVTDIPLGECWLQSVTVNTEDGLPIAETIFCRVDLVRGRGPGGVIVAMLLQGQITALGGLASPW